VPENPVPVGYCKKVVMRSWTGFAGLPFLLMVTGRDPRDLTQPMHPVLAHDDAVFVGEFVSQEPIPQRVVLVEIKERIDQVRVVPVPLRHGRF
jgi:hypothetical protein